MRSPGWPAALHDELMHWHREEAGGGARLRSGPHQLTALPPGDGQPDAAWRHVGTPFPEVLKAVWRHHDGIGVSGDARAPVVAPALWPAAAARPLSATVRFGENDILFEPAAWWWVVALPDGGWCIDGAGRVALWHPQSHQLGPPLDIEAMWKGLAAAWAALRA